MSAIAPDQQPGFATVREILRAAHVFHICPKVNETVDSPYDHPIQSAFTYILEETGSIFSNLYLVLPTMSAVKYGTEVEIACEQIKGRAFHLAENIGASTATSELYELAVSRPGTHTRYSPAEMAAVRIGEEELSHAGLLAWMISASTTLSIGHKLSKSTIPLWHAVMSLIYLSLHMQRLQQWIRLSYDPATYQQVEKAPPAAEVHHRILMLSQRILAMGYEPVDTLHAAKADILATVQDKLNKAVLDLLLARRSVLADGRATAR